MVLFSHNLTDRETLSKLGFVASVGALVVGAVVVGAVVAGCVTVGEVTAGVGVVAAGFVVAAVVAAVVGTVVTVVSALAVITGRSPTIRQMASNRLRTLIFIMSTPLREKNLFLNMLP